MNIPIYQVVILTILAFIEYNENKSTKMFIYNPILSGVIAGIVVGDVQLGFYVGCILTSYQLGLGPFGGSSVPDWTEVALIVVPICYYQGGMDAVPTVVNLIGIPLGALTVQMDVLARTFNSFWQHRVDAEVAGQRRDKVILINWWCGAIFFGLSRGITCLICLLVGPDLIATLAEVIPAQINAGLKIATNMMPAVGLAILLRYLPTKKYIHYLLFGFALAAYFSAPSLAVAIIGIFLAVIHYSNNNKDVPNAEASTNLMDSGGNYDE